MKREEFTQIATKQDLEEFAQAILEGVKDIIPEHFRQKKLFFSPKEFASATGIPYSTILNHCKVGKLMARQNEPNGCWLIPVSEIERFQREAQENI